VLGIVCKNTRFARAVVNQFLKNMKTIVLFPLLLLTVVTSSSQDTKGARPINQSTSQPVNQTRAVVVGISDYQHKSITDLHFADRDAEAFADWLSRGLGTGGNLSPEQIQLLTNGRATAAQVVAALDGLVDSCAEGDVAIIYFSGHGDIEKVTARQNGYLLCHDSPATGYPAGGTLSLGYLADIVFTIAEKKCKVVLVTDACHAGKLAGAAYNGTQTTNAALAKQFANEVKIMSCQESELSLEGEQWGGGRGVFSYHLVDGLVGFADKNADGMVSLLEIGRYLEDRVSAEAAPHPQTPVTLGDRNFALARVDMPLLAEWQKVKSGGKPAFRSTDMRGILSGQDSAMYQAFQAALQRRDFLEPAGNCADFFYRQLLESASMRQMHGLMRRNYAAALQDEIQQAINALLDNDPYEANNWYFHPEKFSRYPEYLDRAIELLGEKHYLAPSLRSKKAYFEGYAIGKAQVLQEPDPARRDDLREDAKRKYLEAISLEPDAAYLYFAVGDLYFINNPYQTDSLVLWCRRAVERSPTWVTPLLEIAYEYQSGQQRIDQVEKWLLEAQRILPNSYLVMERMAWLRQWQGRRDEAVEMCRRMIALKPDLFNGYATLANTIYNMDGDFVEMEKYARKAVEVSPDSYSNWGHGLWAISLFGLRKKREAIDLALKQIESSEVLDKDALYYWLADWYGQLGEYEKAALYARKCVEENRAPFWQTMVFLNFGKIRIRQGRLPEAVELFEKSLSANASPDANRILTWAWLGDVARLQNRPADAEAYFQKSLAYSSGSVWEEMAAKDEAHYLYGNFLLRQNRLDEAREQFQKSLDMRRKGFWGEYGFALLAARQGKTREALDWLERSLDNYFPEAKPILEEPLFSKLRKTKHFRELMAKHFPATAKQ
jgi:tetratricopeptide (TPR) repeat protein